MKLEYQLSTLALEDIKQIWEYTVENWSAEQAEKYYNEIFESIDLICKNPNSGRSINEVKENYRLKLVGSHLILYKLQGNVISIDRILHQRLDLDNHLEE